MPDPLSVLSDWFLYALGVVGLGGGGGIVGYVRRVDTKATDAKRKAQQNERQLQGDPGDPNSEGVLQIAKHNGEKIDRLNERMGTQHRELMEKFEELRDRVEQGTGGDFYRGGGSGGDVDPADN